MRQKILRLGFGIIIAASILILSGCAKKETKAAPPEYPGWLKYSYKHFIFHYPADSYWGRNIDRFSDAYERYLTEICDFLAIEIPPDTIYFYIHESPEAGRQLTGRPVPFSTDREVHWDRRSPFGLELARFLIRKMNIRMTDFRFLHDGLAALMDYSGYDYHHMTYSLVELKQFIPLDSLADNDYFARADSLHREWEAASIVGFITYNFGINRLKMLWQSTASFSESIQQLFNVDVKRFEDGWLKFAMGYYQGIQVQSTPIDSGGK